MDNVIALGTNIVNQQDVSQRPETELEVGIKTLIRDDRFSKMTEYQVIGVLTSIVHQRLNNA